ncbi:MAG: hypothetical protein ACTSRH_14000 [Promethearchaeota archaeon]
MNLNHRNIIEILKNHLKEIIIDRCQEKGVSVSLGRKIKPLSIIIKAEDCISIQKEEKKNNKYKKCDCIIIFQNNFSLYILIIELKSKIKTERDFLDRFKNCYQKTIQFLKKTFPNFNIEFKIFFFCIFRRNQSITTKYIKSPQNKFILNGKKIDIKTIKTGTNLSDYFEQNHLY